MLVLYVSILTIGFLIIVVLLLKDKKNQQPNPADLLKNLDLESDEADKPTHSTSFLDRLHLENAKPHPSLKAEPLEAKQAAEELKNIKLEPKPSKDMTPQEPLLHSHGEQLTDIKQKLKNTESQSQKYKNDLDISIKEMKKARDYIAELQKTINDKDKEIENLTFELSEKKYNTRLAQEQEKSHTINETRFASPSTTPSTTQPAHVDGDTIKDKDNPIQTTIPQNQDTLHNNTDEQDTNQSLTHSAPHIQKIFIDLPKSEEAKKKDLSSTTLDLNKAEDEIDHDETNNISSNEEKSLPYYINTEDTPSSKPSESYDESIRPTPAQEPSTKKEVEDTTDESSTTYPI